MKRQFLLMMALLAMTMQAQTFEFQYQGRSLADGETVTIAAEEDVFGEMACATNPSENPSNGLMLKLLSGSTARAKATLEITHNTLGASMLQWCMGGECTNFGSNTKLTKQFEVAGSEQVQFDAVGISATGYLMATLTATVDFVSREVKIQFTNGEGDGVRSVNRSANRRVISDLNGRAVNGPVRKGVYIVRDGNRTRKVIVK